MTRSLNISKTVDSSPKNGTASNTNDTPVFTITNSVIPDRQKKIKFDKNRMFIKRVPDRYKDATLKVIAAKSLRKIS